mmetsp:Transcript_47127/g.137016  ORF Transcript_47127/g.137016 Transcript_47127/m.137016 type:complete len:223 (+) Transcript_47127:131-799(+)
MELASSCVASGLPVHGYHASQKKTMNLTRDHGTSAAVSLCCTRTLSLPTCLPTPWTRERGYAGNLTAPGQLPTFAPRLPRCSRRWAPPPGGGNRPPTARLSPDERLAWPTLRRAAALPPTRLAICKRQVASATNLEGDGRSLFLRSSSATRMSRWHNKFSISRSRTSRCCTTSCNSPTWAARSRNNPSSSWTRSSRCWEVACKASQRMSDPLSCTCVSWIVT